MAINFTLTILPRSNTVKTNATKKVLITNTSKNDLSTVSFQSRVQEHQQLVSERRSDTNPRSRTNTIARKERRPPSILRRRRTQSDVDRYICQSDWFSLDAVLNRPTSMNRCNRVWFSFSDVKVKTIPKFPVEEFSIFYYDNFFPHGDQR